jgi:peptidoglycan/LPS O-acetylase OafA/YrhL
MGRTSDLTSQTLKPSQEPSAIAQYHRPDLDWIRCFAAFEVVVCHSDLAVKHFSNDLINQGWYPLVGGIGVEVFFVLSGYLMCLRVPHYRSSLSYLKSRYLRILPLYWIFTALVIVARLINPNWALSGHELTADVVLRSFLVLPQAWYPLLGVGWSLEHEVIFYGLVALLIAASARLTEAPVWFGVALFTLGWCGIAGSVSPGDAAWYLHPLSALTTAFGAGWLYRCYEASADGMVLRILGACLAASIALAALSDGENAVRVVRIAVAVAAFIFIVRLHGGIVRVQSANWVFVPLGEATYSIYLSHWFVLSVCGKALGRLSPPPELHLLIRAVAIALSLLVGLVIFRLVERPLDRWLRRGVPLREVFEQSFWFRLRGWKLRMAGRL